VATIQKACDDYARTQHRHVNITDPAVLQQVVPPQVFQHANVAVENAQVCRRGSGPWGGGWRGLGYDEMIL
jgi:hypothetical protein